MPSDQDIEPGDYAVVTYEDDDGDLLQYVIQSTEGTGLEVELETLPASVDAVQPLLVTWSVSGGINHDASSLFIGTPPHILAIITMPRR